MHAHLHAARAKLIAGLERYYPFAPDSGKGAVIMTTGGSAHQDREDLFVADFYPEFGEYLAGQHAGGYDAEAGHARFLAWLGEHASAGRTWTRFRTTCSRSGRCPRSRREGGRAGPADHDRP